MRYTMTNIFQVNRTIWRSHITSLYMSVLLKRLSLHKCSPCIKPNWLFDILVYPHLERGWLFEVIRFEIRILYRSPKLVWLHNCLLDFLSLFLIWLICYIFHSYPQILVWEADSNFKASPI